MTPQKRLGWTFLALGFPLCIAGDDVVSYLAGLFVGVGSMCLQARRLLGSASPNDTSGERDA